MSESGDGLSCGHSCTKRRDRWGARHARGVSKRKRSLLLMTVAAVVWLVEIVLILFAEDPVFHVVGVISFAAAIPSAIVGGRGFPNRH